LGGASSLNSATPEELTSPRLRNVPPEGVDCEEVLKPYGYAYKSRHTQELTRLRWGRASLDVLGCFPSLVDLSLQADLVHDLSPLVGLKKLKYLGFENLRAKDLSFLGGLTGLERLTLGNMRVEDISQIGRLKNLESLSLSDSEFEDLTPLSELHSLRSLYLSGTKASDLSPLRGLSQLEILN